LIFHYKVNTVQQLSLSENGTVENGSSLSKVPIAAPAERSAAKESWFERMTGIHLFGVHADVARPAWTRSRGGNRGSIWGSPDDIDGLGSNVTELECHKEEFAPGRGLCPDDCAFLARSNGCNWQCVTAEECGVADPEAHVVDRENGVCRRCGVIGCETCKEHEDYCAQCMKGWSLVDGQCQDDFSKYWQIFFVVVGVVLLIVVAWVLDLMCQKTEDSEALRVGIKFRKRVLLRQEKEKKPYPMLTPLMIAPKPKLEANPFMPDRRGSVGMSHGRDRAPVRAVSNLPQELEFLTGDVVAEPPVGGPGNLLHFRFQTAALVWAICALIGWMSLGAIIGKDITILGTISAEDEGLGLQMCQAVRWGTTTRERVKENMLTFTGMFYVCSTLCSLILAAMQTRTYNQVQHGRGTMKDYAAVFDGFPPERGDKRLEEKYKAFLEEATHMRVVGVSICWNFSEAGEEFLALTKDMEEMEGRSGDRRRREQHDSERRSKNPILRFFGAGRDAIDAVVGPALGLGTWPTLPWQKRVRREPAMEERRSATEHKLRSMMSHGKCVAVFGGELERNQAVAVFQQPTAPEFDADRTYEPDEVPPATVGDNTYPIDARKKHHEPENMIWEKVGHDNSSKIGRVFAGIIGIFCLSVVWGLCFYLPYGWYEAYTYAQVGKPPSTLNEVSFTALVVAGNQMVYVLSEWISGWVGFSNSDAQQVLYVIFYTFAILLNAVVDMFIVAYTAYLSMTWQGVMTDDGILLKDLDSMEDVFRSYPMQKVCGRMLFEYNVFSCFIAPFFAEAIFTIVLPNRISERFIKTRQHLTAQDAEEIMSPMKMDLCRYADIIVNMCLCTLSFFLASGWIARNLLGLCFGKLFVIFFDHYRTLRQVKGFFFSTNIIDEAAQALLCVPCGLLAACVSFQYHVPPPPGEERDTEGRLGTLTVCIGTFIFHVAFHLLALWGVVPRVIPKVKVTAQRTYEEAAAHFAANWFSTNPIHCLRSKYIYKHDPPCNYFVRGKEHLIERNEAIGLFYDGTIQNLHEPSTPRIPVPKTPM